MNAEAGIPPSVVASPDFSAYGTLNICCVPISTKPLPALISTCINLAPLPQSTFVSGVTLPKYSELTEEERAKFRADLKFRKRGRIVGILASIFRI